MQDIEKILPGVEFDVTIEEVIRVIAIFDDSDDAITTDGKNYRK
ncbi:hypothetical protein [Clostridium sp.]